MTSAADTAHNAALWDVVSEDSAAAAGTPRWEADGLAWGMFEHPESELHVLGPVRGRRVVEVACGTAPLSGWLARQGAIVLALDLSGLQLSAARAAQATHGVTFPLVRADAEHLPIRDGWADLVISEHGAAAWCDPGAWIGQAARVLRPGGRLVFVTNSPLSAMCVPAEGGPAEAALLRGPEDLVEVRWPGGGVEHHPGHGAWIAVLIERGFVVERLVELRAPAGAAATQGRIARGLAHGIATLDWAQSWPVEDLWVARLAP